MHYRRLLETVGDVRDCGRLQERDYRRLRVWETAVGDVGGGKRLESLWDTALDA